MNLGGAFFVIRFYSAFFAVFARDLDAEQGAPQSGADGVLCVRRSHDREATPLCAVFACEIRICNVTNTTSIIAPTVIKPAA